MSFIISVSKQQQEKDREFTAYGLDKKIQCFDSHDNDLQLLKDIQWNV